MGDKYREYKEIIDILISLLFMTLLMFGCDRCHGQSFYCDMSILDRSHMEWKGERKADASKVVGLYIETDWFTRSQFPSDEACIKWIEERYIELAEIYGKEGISTALTGFWFPSSAAEDWVGTYIEDAFVALNQFGLLRKNAPPGRLKHLISLAGSGGVAWTGTLELDYHTFDYQGVTYHAGPYAVSFGIGLGGVYSEIVMSHEMGHNMGSRHTHDCVWGPLNNLRIDDCIHNNLNCDFVEWPIPDSEKGTVMSYCHLVAYGIQVEKGFGTEPGNLIRSAVDNASRDLLEYPARIMYLTGVIEGGYQADCIIFFNVEVFSPVTLD